MCSPAGNANIGFTLTNYIRNHVSQYKVYAIPLCIEEMRIRERDNREINLSKLIICGNPLISPR